MQFLDCQHSTIDKISYYTTINLLFYNVYGLNWKFIEFWLVFICPICDHNGCTDICMEMTAVKSKASDEAFSYQSLCFPVFDRWKDYQTVGRLSEIIMECRPNEGITHIVESLAFHIFFHLLGHIALLPFRWFLSVSLPLVFGGSGFWVWRILKYDNSTLLIIHIWHDNFIFNVIFL